MVPRTVVVIDSEVSSTERRRGAIVSSPESGFIKHSFTGPPSTGLASAIGNKNKTSHTPTHCFPQNLFSERLAMTLVQGVQKIN